MKYIKPNRKTNKTIITPIPKYAPVTTNLADLVPNITFSKGYDDKGYLSSSLTHHIKSSNLKNVS